MDNFKRRRKPKSSFGDTEGFVRRPAKADAAARSPQQRAQRAYMPAKAAQMQAGGMKRADGFFPRRLSGPTSDMPDGRALGRKLGKKPDIDMTLDNPKNKTRRIAIKDRSKFIKRSLLIGGSLAVLLIGLLIFKGYWQLKQVFGGGGECTILECEIDPSQLKGEGDGRVNILLLGRGGEGHEGPDLTDTILIASIDPINNDAGLLSLPRDMYVQVPGNGSMKINSVFYTYKQQALNEGKKIDVAEKAAVEAVGSTVSNIIGIPIHRYGIVDFKGFEKAVNTVGGIDIDVKKPVYENMWINGPYTLNVPKGWQHFNGKRALAYSRSRYTSARGDFDRAERQREVIVALRNKTLSLGTFSNPVKISSLLDTFGAHVKTNLSINEMKKLYDLGENIDGGKIKSLSLVDPPNDFLTTANLGGLSIVQPKAGLNNYEEIKRFVRNEFKDGFIRKENPGLMVLNGTSNNGLANQKAEELKGFGYNVVHIGNAPNRSTPNTILVDLRGGEKKYTKRYLELRFKTTATGKLPSGITPPENADFVIILGQQ